MITLSQTKVAGLLDELEKIGFDAATAMEAIGIPAAAYMGYRQHGLKGALTTGLGAAAGLGAGMAGSHLVNKMISPQNTSLLASIARAAPIGMGGVLGGAAGEHFAEHGLRPHKVVTAAAKVKLSGLLMDYLVKKTNPIIAFDTINDVGKFPDRYQRAMDGFQSDYLEHHSAPGNGVSASNEIAEPTRGIRGEVQAIESGLGALKRAL